MLTPPIELSEELTVREVVARVLQFQAILPHFENKALLGKVTEAHMQHHGGRLLGHNALGSTDSGSSYDTNAKVEIAQQIGLEHVISVSTERIVTVVTSLRSGAIDSGEGAGVGVGGGESNDAGSIVGVEEQQNNHRLSADGGSPQTEKKTNEEEACLMDGDTTAEHAASAAPQHHMLLLQEHIVAGRLREALALCNQYPTTEGGPGQATATKRSPMSESTDRPQVSIGAVAAQMLAQLPPSRSLNDEANNQRCLDSLQRLAEWCVTIALITPWRCQCCGLLLTSSAQRIGFALLIRHGIHFACCSSESPPGASSPLKVYIRAGFSLRLRYIQLWVTTARQPRHWSRHRTQRRSSPLRTPLDSRKCTSWLPSSWLAIATIAVITHSTRQRWHSLAKLKRLMR